MVLRKIFNDKEDFHQKYLWLNGKKMRMWQYPVRNH